ncbi:MAG TPA: class I SAM-dependent methyltransferase [Blastocatellia bacterium]|nr:class I SAM-dependent methyltransferase [Blastocatellia bacterium]
MEREEHDERLNAIYEHLWSAHDGELYARLDQSLSPRPPGMLFDLVETLGIKPGALVLDAGCGRGNHACELARRFGFQVEGLEIADANLKVARNAVAEGGLTGKVEIIEGSIENIPFEDGTFDLIWCRDMLMHLRNLRQGIEEFSRTLKRAGWMVILTTFATDSMEAKEAESLYGPLGMIAENLNRIQVETMFGNSGLRIHSSETISAELLEYYDERDGRYGRELMRLARMSRAKERFLAELGEIRYQTAQALYRWSVYLLLGKLSSTIYVLKKEDARQIT